MSLKIFSGIIKMTASLSQKNLQQMASRWLPPSPGSHHFRIHTDTTNFFNVEYGDVAILGGLVFALSNSIVEELMPVAVPVYGGKRLGRAATQRLLRVAPSAETRTELEVKEALADALGIEGLEQLFGDALEARRVELHL